MYIYLLIILIMLFEMNSINMIGFSFPINYEIYLSEIWEIINNQKEKLNPLMIKIGYHLVYGFSLCQIQYNRIKNVVSPKINILRSSINNYLKNNGIMVEKNDQMLILIDNNGNEIHNIIISNKDDIKSIEDLCNDVKYSGIIFVDKNDEMGCINRVFYEKFPESFEYEVSDMKFMGIELEHNDKTHVINLKNNSYNYYIVNNSLNQNFFKYYIKNVIKTDIIEDNFDYKITIVDYNVNLITLLPHQYIIIDKNNYHVFPILSENTIDITITQNNINDTLSTNSDSDKSDDFIKLDTTTILTT